MMYDDAAKADTGGERGRGPAMVLGMPAWALTALAPLILIQGMEKRRMK